MQNIRSTFCPSSTWHSRISLT